MSRGWEGSESRMACGCIMMKGMFGMGFLYRYCEQHFEERCRELASVDMYSANRFYNYEKRRISK